MRVEKLMKTDVGTCAPADKASLAAKIMWERDCGAVPVVDERSRVIGMVTDRDLCIASYMQGDPLGYIPVQSAMSRELWSCRADDDLSKAEQVMREHQVRRLPVIDAEGHLIGMLSLSDIAREATKEARGKRKKIEVSYADVGQTLGEINVPHAVLHSEARAS
jgi:CBS domain-containing protein